MTINKLLVALRDIADHAKPPFMEGRWANYIREVAEQALSETMDKEIP